MEQKVYKVYNPDRLIIDTTPIKEQAVKAAMNYSKDDKENRCYGVSNDCGGITWFSKNGFVCNMWGT